MRPTDENQHGSTRPNLMSPARPGGGEDNILAMLERDAGRGRGSQFSSHPRMAWYAGAGAVVVAMVAALGWLAWENATKSRELPVEMMQALPVSDTQVAAAPTAPAAAAAATIDAEQTLPAAPATASVDTEQPTPASAAGSGQVEVAARPTAGAAIIDSPAVPAEAPAGLAQAAAHVTSLPQAPVMLAQAGAHAAHVAQPSSLPPLVLLPPEEAGSKRTPAAPAAATSRSKPAAAVSPKADAARASRPIAKAEAALTPRRADKADAAPALRRAAKADAAPTSRATSAKAPPRRPARPAIARAKKANTSDAAANSPDASADTDVALISAIIMHSSKHAAERAKAEAAKSCDGAKCPGKPTAKH